MRPVEVEQFRVEDRIERHLTEIGLLDARIGIERADDLMGKIALFGGGDGNLVQDHDIGELDLFDEQVDQRALIVLAKRLAAITQEVARGVVLQQIGRIDHRHHRIEPRDIRQAVAPFVAKLESGGDGQRLGNPGRFDQEVIEPALRRQLPDFLQKIVAQRAADAAIGHFDELLFRTGKIGSALADQRRIYIHLAHIVDDHRHAAVLAIVEHVIESVVFPAPRKPERTVTGSLFS